MTTVHIGVPSLRGDLARYAEKFDLLEVRPLDESTPRPTKLRQWRKDVGPAFVFSVVLPSAVSELKPSPAADEALTKALAAADALEARCLVITTPAHVTPTAPNRARLRALVERLPRDVVTVAWEPRGLWDTADASSLAQQLDVTLIIDAAHESPPPGPTLYTRLRGLGVSAQLGPAAVDRVRSAMRGRREAFVVIEAAAPARIEQALRRPVGGTRPPTHNIIRPPILLSAEDEEQ